MRNRYIYMIFSLCSIVMTISFLRLSHSMHGGIPGGSRQPAFTHSVKMFLHSSDEQAEETSYTESAIQHPTEEETPASEASEIKAKLEDCGSAQPLRFDLPFLAVFRRHPPEEPMTVRNARHSSITLRMIPAPKGKRSSWTIAPGLTWKTYTGVGQRWLFADHNRCLFYVTAGEEPLKMVVKSS